LTKARNEQTVEEQYKNDLLVARFTNFDIFEAENLCQVKGIFSKKEIDNSVNVFFLVKNIPVYA